MEDNGNESLKNCQCFSCPKFVPKMDFGIWKNMTTSTKLYKADNFASKDWWEAPL